MSGEKGRRVLPVKRLERLERRNCFVVIPEVIRDPEVLRTPVGTLVFHLPGEPEAITPNESACTVPDWFVKIRQKVFRYGKALP